MVVTDQAFGGTDAEEELARSVGADFASHQCSTEEETLAATRGADVVLVNFAPITDAVLAGLADHAAVVRYGIGYDNVDAERRNAMVWPWPMCPTTAVTPSPTTPRPAS